MRETAAKAERSACRSGVGEGRWWSRITEGWSERVDAKKREEKGEGVGWRRGQKLVGKAVK